MFLQASLFSKEGLAAELAKSTRDWNELQFDCFKTESWQLDQVGGIVLVYELSYRLYTNVLDRQLNALLCNVFTR